MKLRTFVMRLFGYRPEPAHTRPTCSLEDEREKTQLERRQNEVIARLRALDAERRVLQRPTYRHHP